jgi:hypothetical protein
MFRQYGTRVIVNEKCVMTYRSTTIYRPRIFKSLYLLRYILYLCAASKHISLFVWRIASHYNYRNKVQEDKFQEETSAVNSTN